MLQAGDLVKVRDNAAIPAFAGAVGIISRYLGKSPKENDVNYYEVNIAAQGSQILLERELTLLRKADKNV